jgi:hypothetical protein
VAKKKTKKLLLIAGAGAAVLAVVKRWGPFRGGGA